MTKPLNGRPSPGVLRRVDSRLASATATLTEKVERIESLEQHYHELKRRALSNPYDKDDEQAYAALIDQEYRELGRLLAQAVRLGLSIGRYLAEFVPRR